MSHERISLGKEGENLVAAHILKQGYVILMRNYRIFSGEIDIIAQKESVIAFIEVKMRTSSYCAIADLVPYHKQQKIIRTACNFIARNSGAEDLIYRFDVALVEQSGTESLLTYIPDAFRKE